MKCTALPCLDACNIYFAYLLKKGIQGKYTRDKIYQEKKKILRGTELNSLFKKYGPVTIKNLAEIENGLSISITIIHQKQVIRQSDGNGMEIILLQKGANLW
jgi:hypothetical protein